jgi:dethiobiotin synthetase
VLSAALLAAMAAAGEDVRAYKPLLTGTDEPEPADGWPRDDELLAAAAGRRTEEVTTRRYGPAVSPHLAAELSGERIDPRELIAAAERLAGSPRAGRTLIVEGVGGLLVPIVDEQTVCDLAVALGLPVLVAARPGLGTINHTLLTLRAAAAAGLDVRAVVFTPWPSRPDAIERSNRETVARLGRVEVATLPAVASPRRGQLALAAAGLPWRRWLE